MTISILLAQQIAQLFLMIFMGFLIVKAGLLKDEDSKVLSKIVLYLIIPCVILMRFRSITRRKRCGGCWLRLRLRF